MIEFGSPRTRKRLGVLHSNMNKNKYGAITSSTDPEEIATRVKGIVLTLSSIIILVASLLFHITLTPVDITTWATEIGMVAGAVTTIYGFVMWGLAKIFKTPTA